MAMDSRRYDFDPRESLSARNCPALPLLSTISRGESWPAAEREGGDEMWSEREARRHSQKRLQHVGSSNRWSRSIIRENNNFGNRV